MMFVQIFLFLLPAVYANDVHVKLEEKLLGMMPVMASVEMGKSLRSSVVFQTEESSPVYVNFAYFSSNKCSGTPIETVGYLTGSCLYNMVYSTSWMVQSNKDCSNAQITYYTDAHCEDIYYTASLTDLTECSSNFYNSVYYGKVFCTSSVYSPDDTVTSQFNWSDESTTESCEYTTDSYVTHGLDVCQNVGTVYNSYIYSVESNIIYMNINTDNECTDSVGTAPITITCTQLDYDDGWTVWAQWSIGSSGSGSAFVDSDATSSSIAHLDPFVCVLITLFCIAVLAVIYGMYKFHCAESPPVTAPSGDVKMVTLFASPSKAVVNRYEAAPLDTRI